MPDAPSAARAEAIARLCRELDRLVERTLQSAACDRPALRDHAHELRGVAAMHGCERLALHALLLEQRAATPARLQRLASCMRSTAATLDAVAIAVRT